jgi:hypothetical protein
MNWHPRADAHGLQCHEWAAHRRRRWASSAVSRASASAISSRKPASARGSFAKRRTVRIRMIRCRSQVSSSSRSVDTDRAYHAMMRRVGQLLWASPSPHLQSIAVVFDFVRASSRVGTYCHWYPGRSAGQAAPPRPRLQGREFACDPCRRFPGGHQFRRRLKYLRHEPFAPLAVALEVCTVLRWLGSRSQNDPLPAWCTVRRSR